MTGKRPSLDAAYAVTTPADNKRLYDEWAASYDDDLRSRYDYVYPSEIASLFERLGGSGPVLDIGCGTGLVGEALRGHGVDGVDISPEMLAVASRKGVYRRLIEADLTRPLPFADATYAGFVSAGVFTEGHVGPELLRELVRVAAPNALFALGVNERVFERLGFPEALARLREAGEIDEPTFPTIAIYGEAAQHENAENQGVAAIFRRRA